MGLNIELLQLTLVLLSLLKGLELQILLEVSGQAIADATQVRRRWEYYDLFDSAPGTSDYVKDRSGVETADELHIVVIDTDGSITGVPNQVIETFAGVSKLSDARKADGSTNYYVDVIYNESTMIYWMDHPSVGTGYGDTIATQAQTLFTALSQVITTDTLTGGADGTSAFTLSDGEAKDGIDRFKDTETVDLSLFMCGKASATKAGNALDMCTDRKDAVAFVSPEFLMLLMLRVRSLKHQMLKHSLMH